MLEFPVGLSDIFSQTVMEPCQCFPQVENLHVMVGDAACDSVACDGIVLHL